MTINDRVKEARNALHLTQKEFGQKITTAQTYLSQIEKGDRDVTEKILKLICLQFGVNEEYLRNGIEPMFVESDHSALSALVAEYDLNGVDAQILQTYIQLPEQARGTVRDFLLQLADAVKSGQVKTINEFIQEPSPEGTTRVFRAANSTSNKPPTYVNMPNSTIEKLRNAPPVTEI